MANRPVFGVYHRVPFYMERAVEFQYFSGFADSQKKKSIRSLHDAYRRTWPEQKVLEISSKSEEALGVKLSAFHLMLPLEDGREVSVECAFQSSKVFAKGGPYTDLQEKTSREAKKDPRLKESGELIGFRFQGMDFPLKPVNLFYNWLYMNALHAHPELSEQVMGYDAFTDIEFNPQRSLNCQARAAAVYVGLGRQGLLEEALDNPADFLRVVCLPKR